MGGTPEPKPVAEARMSATSLKSVPATPIAIEAKKLDKPSWDPEWNEMIEENLPSRLLSGRREKQVSALCPRYRNLTKDQRRVFWAYFFQALAGAEAGLNPVTDVHHTDPQVDIVDRVTHLHVRQEGLLQLTYMDDLRYGCNFDWVRDRDLPEHDPDKSILEPRNNLFCGIKIVERQLVKHHEPLLNDGSYWSTLRPDNASFAVFKKQMANVPAYCSVDENRQTPTESGQAPMVTAQSQRPAAKQSENAANRGMGFEVARAMR